MTPLLDLLLERIARQGALSVADYMALALGHPDHGYYRRRDPLGRAGDFITAPEISQTFGEMIGLWCAETWAALGRPARVALAELGPGRGTLMADLLRAAAVVPAFAGAISVHLVETSPALRARQAAVLGRFAPVWHDRWDTLPDGPLLVVANEFIDALPIRQYVRRADGWRERLVGRTGDALCFQDGPPASFDAGPAPAGTICERNETAAGLARYLGRRVAAGGAALIVDYGAAASGFGDTLQAVRRHAFAPVLDDPGEADLSAHVDFAAFARAAAPARTLGPVDQGDFLVRLGIRERTEALISAHPEQAGALLAGCRRLIDGAEMGTLFKVLALVPRDCSQPPGFTN